MPWTAVRRRPVARVLAACALALAALVALAGSSRAADPGDLTAEQLGLTVTTGLDGHARRGAWLPVTVDLDPDRAFAGTIAVRSGGPGGTVVNERRVEAPAGTTKRFHVVSPPADRLVVEAVPDGGEPVQVRGSTRFDPPRVVLVGLAGGALPDAPEVDTQPTGQPAVYADVAREWLTASPRALHALDTLVLPATLLDELSDAELDTVAGAVGQGLQLVVAAPAAGPVALDRLGLSGVPAVEVVAGATPPARHLAGADERAWTLRGDGSGGDAGDAALAAAFPAGRGRVAVTVADASTATSRHDALWPRLLQPRDASDAHGGPLRERQGAMLTAVEPDAGTLGLPGVGTIAIFVLVYVLVVGPVTGLVLTRTNRREAAWVAVPTLTVAFTAVAFTITGSASPSVGVSASASWWLDGASGHSQLVAVRAPRGGAQVVELPGLDWDVTTQTIGPAARVTLGDDTSVELDLEPLEVGSVLAHAPEESAPPLAVRARSDGDAIAVEVDNLGGDGLEVDLYSAGHVTSLGTVAPGDRATTAMDGDLQALDPFLIEQVPARPDGPGRETRRLHPLVADLVDHSPGTVWALATVEGGDTPTVGGGPAQVTGRLVAVGTTVAAAQDGTAAPAAVRRDVATLLPQDGFDAPWRQPSFIDGADEVVLRFRLPPGATAPFARSLLHRSDGPGMPPDACPPGAECPDEEEPAVWDASSSRWVAIDDAFPGSTAPASRVVSDLGEFHVRFRPGGPFEFSRRAIAAVAQGQP